MTIACAGRRRGSILIVVVWMLLGASMIVFAVQAEALEAQKEAHGHFRAACTRWTARGGVHYAVGFMNTFAPQPALALDVKPAPDFYRSQVTAEELGWFLADYPNPSDDGHYGIFSEQGRIPLSNLTTSAFNILFSDGQVRNNVRDYITSRKVLAKQGGGTPQTEQAQVVRHPLELLSVAGVTLGLLMGQDWNDNGVLDPHEESRKSTGPSEVRVETGLAVDRGLADTATAFTDGKLDPYSARPSVRSIYLGDFPEQAAMLESADGRPAPALFAPNNPDWVNFATNNLTPISTYFRIQAFGTYRGQSLARVRVVVQYVEEQNAQDNWYRIVDWRQDG